MVAKLRGLGSSRSEKVPKVRTLVLSIYSARRLAGEKYRLENREKAFPERIYGILGHQLTLIDADFSPRRARIHAKVSTEIYLSIFVAILLLPFVCAQGSQW